MYGQMVLYIEACESGSMFEGLLASNINVYATTAANSIESSWGTYCSPDDVVDGTHIGSCLGDLYSVNWMEDSDASDVSKETLGVQFATVKLETAQSHVMEFGQFDFKTEVIGDFQGDLDIPVTFYERLLRQTKIPFDRNDKKHISAISSRDVRLNQLYGNVINNPDHMSHIEL